jgi:hypothetical protein
MSRSILPEVSLKPGVLQSLKELFKCDTIKVIKPCGQLFLIICEVCVTDEDRIINDTGTNNVPWLLTIYNHPGEYDDEEEAMAIGRV